MMGGRDDDARNRRAEAETEVACDSSERGRCGALLRRDQGQGQDLAGGSHESEAGTADGRADEALPRTVDKRQAPVAECVQNSARDQDPFRTETIEERTRGSVTTAAVPMTVASTSPAVAVEKPRIACR
jgi:hypothetical protein